ncbi:MAG: FAD binding domain-containing protein [Alicyclobacillus sp.]|nr:FAD binding domain-containing protein [Alicyclobacillus sp.]
MPETVGWQPSVWLPGDVETAWSLHRQFGPDACYVAGGTLLQVQWQSGTHRPRHLVSLERIPGLCGVRWIRGELGARGGKADPGPEPAAVGNSRSSVAAVPTAQPTEGLGREDGVEIGAMMSLAECRVHPELRGHWPLLAAACQSVGAPAVRNRGTLGGNLRSQTGDTVPALLALDAAAVWFDETGYRVRPLAEWPDDPSAVLAAVRLPAPDHRPSVDDPLAADPLQGRLSDEDWPADHPPADHPPANDRGTACGLRRVSIFRKVGRRAAFTPSIVTLAVTCEWTASEVGWQPGIRRVGQGVRTVTKPVTPVGYTPPTQVTGVRSSSRGFPSRPSAGGSGRALRRVRVAVGGADVTPHRLTPVERLLEGAEPGPDLWALLHAAVLDAFQPPENAWASADYRRWVAANILCAELAAACRRLEGGGSPCNGTTP